MKNKGFTLAEVLASVTIMLMITIIAVPTSMKFIEKGKNQQYEMLEDQILSEASKYYIKHKDNKCIELSHLINGIDDKFLDGNKIIDPRNNKELKGIVEVRINENKVKYNLISETSDICTVKNYPTLAKGNTWYKGSTAKTTITEINIVDKASPDITFNEKWNVAVDTDGDGNLNEDIKCYINGTTLTIAGNGTGKIFANSNSQSLFADFSNLTEINGLNLLDTSKVTDMSYMFMSCYALSSLDLSNFVTSNVTTMEMMFSGCAFTSLNLSSFDTSNVTNMSFMFYVCDKLTTLNLSSFDISNQTDIHDMLTGCDKLTTITVKTMENTGRIRRESHLDDTITFKIAE